MTAYVDPALHTAKRAILDGLRINGGRCAQAALSDGGVLMPNGSPMPMVLAARALRSLADDGLVRRHVIDRTMVWALVDGGDR